MWTCRSDYSSFIHFFKCVCVCVHVPHMTFLDVILSFFFEAGFLLFLPRLSKLASRLLSCLTFCLSTKAAGSRDWSQLGTSGRARSALTISLNQWAISLPPTPTLCFHALFFLNECNFQQRRRIILLYKMKRIGYKYTETVPWVWNQMVWIS